MTISPVPAPAVTLNDTSVMAGSNATLQCSVMLADFSSYSSGMVAVTVELLNSDDAVVSSMLTSGSSDTRTADLTVSTVDVFKAGQYRCNATVNYTGINQNFVSDPSETTSPGAALNLQSKHNLIFAFQSNTALQNHRQSLSEHLLLR